MPSDVEELFDAKKSPAENARSIALQKARSIAEKVHAGVVFGADTIVVIGKQMLAKPISSTDAVRMLSMLSGKTHTVVTGMAFVDAHTGYARSKTVKTEVTFRSLGKSEIIQYVKGGSPMDKAGAYGIQDDYGAVFIRRISGCYYNVVGLPLAEFYLMHKKFLKTLKMQNRKRRST